MTFYSERELEGEEEEVEEERKYRVHTNIVNSRKEDKLFFTIYFNNYIMNYVKTNPSAFFSPGHNF